MIVANTQENYKTCFLLRKKGKMHGHTRCKLLFKFKILLAGSREQGWCNGERISPSTNVAKIQFPDLGSHEG